MAQNIPAIYYALGRRVGVHIFSVLQDNFSYLIALPRSKLCWAVDPVEPLVLQQKAAEEGLTFRGCFVTHKHWDHSNGNAAFRKMAPAAPIYASQEVPHVTNVLTDEEEIVLGEGISVKAMLTPCHTKHHMCFYLTGCDVPALFTGDTLFLGGCGRFFEGSAEDMMQIVEKLKSLPPETLIFCGHEYTSSNARFAMAVAPNNKASRQLWDEALHCRRKGVPTVPRPLSEQWLCNPFLRVGEEEVQVATRSTNDTEAMRRLRKLKDDYSSRVRGLEFDEVGPGAAWPLTDLPE